MNDILVSYADDIRTKYREGMALAKKSVTYMITVGRYLQEARDLIDGDKEFGQWRKDAIPEISSRLATNLMGVYRRFGDRDVNLSFSAMTELLPAPDDVIEEVVQESANNPLTVAEIRDKVKAAKKAKEQPAKKAKEQPKDYAEPKLTMNRVGVEEKKEVSLVDETQDIVNLPVEQRVKRSKDAYVIFGLSPFIEGQHNIDNIELIYREISKKQSGKTLEAIQIAYHEITGYYD
jgi:hypothetical protein